MQVIISGHHLEVTDALRAHTEEKVAKLARHFDKVIDELVSKLDRQILKHKEKHASH